MLQLVRLWQFLSVRRREHNFQILGGRPQKGEGGGEYFLKGGKRPRRKL